MHVPRDGHVGASVYLCHLLLPLANVGCILPVVGVPTLHTLRAGTPGVREKLLSPRGANLPWDMLPPNGINHIAIRSFVYMCCCVEAEAIGKNTTTTHNMVIALSYRLLSMITVLPLLSWH